MKCILSVHVKFKSLLILVVIINNIRAIRICRLIVVEQVSATVPVSVDLILAISAV